MIKLNKRLSMVAAFVPNKVSIIDVGCDHAFLSIYLKLNRTDIRVVASDINIGPLNIAIDNIKKYGLSNKIDTILMDGIENIPDYIDTIVISGMGSITMSNILKEDKLSNIKKIILSPNNDFYLIRKYMSDLGYKIVKEDMVLENGKYYPVILFEKGDCNYSSLEFKYGPLLMKNRPLNFLDYLLFRKKQINEILIKLDNSCIEYEKMQQEVNELDNLLD